MDYISNALLWKSPKQMCDGLWIVCKLCWSASLIFLSLLTCFSTKYRIYMVPLHIIAQSGVRQNPFTIPSVCLLIIISHLIWLSRTKRNHDIAPISFSRLHAFYSMLQKYTLHRWNWKGQIIIISFKFTN